LRQFVSATVPPLEARLAQTSHDLALIQNSRTWRVREALAHALRLGRPGAEGPAFQHCAERDGPGTAGPDGAGQAIQPDVVRNVFSALDASGQKAAKASTHYI
jgi:hypothetical protein